MKIIILVIAIFHTLTLDWSPLEKVIQDYRRNGSYPGAVIRIANKTHTIYSNQFGFIAHDSGPYSIPFKNQTIFDIASLTKVTGTLGCVMQLVDLGQIDIDDQVVKYIPQFNNNGKSLITVQNLLLHNSGLLPDVPGSYRHSKQQAMNFIYNCTQYVYSDINFILLGIICEKVIGVPLEDYVKINLQRLEVYNTTYLPKLQNFYKIAPTQYSSDRKTLIRGNVHDPTAFLFGGVAGHAGLFSVADDLVTYMQVHLNKGVTKSKKRVYSQEIVEQFSTRVDGLPYQNRRALGWDTVPIQEHPPCGHLFSPNSFGHTGFTGTMMWADRDKDLIIVFLTNRVHPTANNGQGIKAARSDVCDTTVRILNLG